MPANRPNLTTHTMGPYEHPGCKSCRPTRQSLQQRSTHLMGRCQPIVQISQHTQWAHTSTLAETHAGPSDSLRSNSSYTSWADAGQSSKSHNTHNGPIQASWLQVTQAHPSISAAAVHTLNGPMPANRPNFITYSTAHTSILAETHAGPSDSLGGNTSYTSWADAGQSSKSYNTQHRPIRASRQ
jgi:hypothetical protein